MTQTVLVGVSAFWIFWTVFEIAAIYAAQSGRSRVPGALLSRLPGVRRIGRRKAEKRIREVVAALERIGVSERHRPDEAWLVERWHHFTMGRCVTTFLQGVPLMVPLLALAWASDPEGRSTAPYWVFALFGAFSVASLVIMAVDDRVVRSCDAAGMVTVKAFSCLEALLLRRGGPARQSALDSSGTRLNQLCRALRDQARYEARNTRPEDRARAEDLTDRLIRNLGDRDHQVLFSQGAGRDTATLELAQLISSALRYSCRRRYELDHLLFVDEELLSDIPAAQASGASGEPLGSRLAKGVVPPAVAAALLAGAALLPGTGAAAEVLALAGAGLVLAWPPLRTLLERGGVPLPLPATRVHEDPEQPPAGSPPAAAAVRCPYCADGAAATGSRPAG